MKKAYSMILLSSLLCACSGNGKEKEAIEQIQYSKTHTAYADSAALQYALDHEITPDSAVVVLNSGKR